MANILQIVDSNPIRRSQFINQASKELPLIDGLHISTIECGSFTCIMALSISASCDISSQDSHVEIVIGQAIESESGNQFTSKHLSTLHADIGTWPHLDGYFFASSYHVHYGLVVGVDLLGLFPVYYAKCQDVILLGTSPELFQYHPLFHSILDTQGLVGILLTNGLVSGRTLLNNVTRLGPGNLLVVEHENLPREVTHFQLPLGDDQSLLARAPLSIQIETLKYALDDAVIRLARDSNPLHLLLSGGLDSRTIAGVLNEHAIPTRAITLGQEWDLEHICANAVIHELRWSQTHINASSRSIIDQARSIAKWEHLAGGFSFFSSWNVARRYCGIRSYIMTGFLMDLLLGGPKPASLFRSDLSLDKFFSLFVNPWGMPPEAVSQLMAILLDVRSTSDLVRSVRETLDQEICTLADTRFTQGWKFALHHRQRFHVGSNVWRLSFGSWPVLPALSRNLIQTAMSLHSSVVADRMIQRNLLQHYYPKLARCPLDRNSFDISPLASISRQVYVSKMVRRKYLELQHCLGIERRYYYRIFDINGPYWSEIHRHFNMQNHVMMSHNVDSLRSRLSKKCLEKLLPSRSHRMSRTDDIVDTSKYRLLFGLGLWLGQHSGVLETI